MTDDRQASVRSRFEAYLSRIGRLKEPKLGSGEGEAPLVTAEDNAFLGNSLWTAARRNDRVFWICVTLLCLLFVLQFGLLLYSVDCRNVTGLVAGGSVAAFLPILWFLRRLWIDWLLIGITRRILQELPPAEAVKAVQTIYWTFLRRTRKGTG